MIESLVGTFEEMPLNPGIDVYEIKFKSEAKLSCCFASVAELNAYGEPQVASANLMVMNTGIIPGEEAGEWKVRVRISSSWAGVLKGCIALLCV